MAPVTDGIPFEVEGSFEALGRAYVVARLLDPAARVALTECAALDGRPIEPWMEIPRALNAQGEQRYDLFGFCLRTPADRAHFTEQRRITLTV